MIHGVLVDTGPLVAALNHHDRYHQWARARLAEIAPPILTCEPVMAEVCFLMQSTRHGVHNALELIRRGELELPFRTADHIESLMRLMKKYADVPMSLADACLVRMSELYPGSILLTLDSDFLLYRRNGRQVIPAWMPPHS